MNIYNVDSQSIDLNKLIIKTNLINKAILLKSDNQKAVLISESEWNNIQETIYLSANVEFKESIIEGKNTKIEDCLDNLEW